MPSSNGQDGTAFSSSKDVVVIGGGPAGLTTAYELGKAGVPTVVLEKDDTVGGISRTAQYKGYRFDIGGHRFFTKVQVVEDMWEEVLDEEDFLVRDRLSRIYYDKKFFYYPLQATDALSKLGLWNSFLIGLSYLNAQFFPYDDPDNFEEWVSNHFGTRLYKTFFKTYTEKVWGIPCTEISADWAAQRIKGLSLITALKNAIIEQATQDQDKDDIIETLIDSFKYPKRGPGMMWETVTRKVREQGNEVRMQSEVTKILRSGHQIEAVEVTTDEGTERVEGTDFVSSMPIRSLFRRMEPAPSEAVRDAAEKLKYRDFLTVALIIDHPDLFPDNWIYIHDPDVEVGRVQNFKNWSPYMVPDDEKTCVGLEYFCFEGDGLWTSADEDLVAKGTREIDQLGLADAEDVEDGCVVRMPKAYPVYDSEYEDALAVIQNFIETVDNLQLVGRNGMHRYNNQDHSMLTAMLAARNIMGANYDLWKVNDDESYHEEVSEDDDPYSKQLEELDDTQPRVLSRTGEVK